jgi:predicted DNA-binding transcriptional regulator YafY
VHPYGLVAHRGRWYLTGADEVSGEVRTFRLDRIARVRPAEGVFAAPADFQPAEAVLASLAGTPWRHRVTVRVRGAAEDVSARLPRGLATIEPAAEEGWVLVRLRAERLDWLPGVLGGLGLSFAVVEPAELRDAVRVWAEQVAAWNGVSS